jgi:hypothetical protein
VQLEEYLEDRTGMVEEALQEFIHTRYQDPLLEMASHVAARGKRVRGAMAILCCEAMGGDAREALVAACAVELAHAVSLVKDDIMDNDEQRRGLDSFWKRFGLNLGLLVPDVILPHAMLFTQRYGWRALGSVVDAWGRIAQGQVLDFPKGGFTPPVSYQQIIELKTAPLFELTCELGIRAARMDWQVSLGKSYGYACGMAFQVYDDYTDVARAVGQPWEATARGPLPVSISCLRKLLGSGTHVRPEDPQGVLTVGEGFLSQAEEVACTFPETEFKPFLHQLPRWCCQSLIAEMEEQVVDASRLPGQLQREPG